MLCIALLCLSISISISISIGFSISMSSSIRISMSNRISIIISIVRSHIWLKSPKSEKCESGCHIKITSCVHTLLHILLKAALHSLQSVYILNSLNFPENILNSLQSVHIFRIVTGT